MVSRCTAHTLSREMTPSHNLNKRAILIPQAYQAFQISDGLAGDCARRAANVFLTPYGLDQRTVLAPNPFRVRIDSTDLQVCQQMAKSASDSEASFNGAISAVGGVNTAIGRELQNGKICNKVLKLTGQVLCLQMSIKLTQDPLALSTITDKINNLQKNINSDVLAANQRQRSFLRTGIRTLRSSSAFRII